MTTKTSQAMIANGLAELSFPLTQTPLFNTELPPAHPLSGLVLGYLLAPSTKQDDHAQPHPNPQILFSATLSACDTHPQSLKLTIINHLLSLI